MAGIQVSEVNEINETKWTVCINHGGVERQCQVRDPLFINYDLTEEDVRWLLEDYPTLFPYDVASASQKNSALIKYGELLAEQLDLQSTIQNNTNELATMWVVNICDYGGDSVFQKLLWETLEPALAKDGFKVFVRRNVTLPPVMDERILEEEKSSTTEAHGDGKQLIEPNAVDATPPRPCKVWFDGKSMVRRINILLVVSRPSRRDDINPLIATNGIIDAMNRSRELQRATLGSESGLQIRVEISRPGTWTAFKKHLEDRTDFWRRAGGTGGWFDLVHFDCHGAVRDGIASLLFLSSSGNKTLRCSAKKIGDLIRFHKVKQVVLHSCETAKVTRSTQSNMAVTLINMGIETVIAMSFKFTTSAAEIFVKAFYDRLFNDSSANIERAFLFARTILKHEKTRLARFNLERQIPDYIVPVLYSSQRDDASMADMDQAVDEFTEKGIHSERYKATDEEEILGREHDVLEIEWQLLRSPKNNILLLTGDVGSGKSSLLGLLMQVWGSSGLLSSASAFDMRQDDVAPVIQFLQALKASEDEIPGDKKMLILIDSLDAVIHPTGVYKHMMSSELRAAMKQAILDLQGINVLVVIASRQEENWLGLPQSQLYRLKPLTKYHTTSIVSRILKSLGKEDFLEGDENLLYIEYLMYRLDYNPLSLELFLGSAVAQREYVQGKDQTVIDEMGDMPDTPKLLFTLSLRDGLIMDDDHQMKKEISFLTEKLLGEGGGNAVVLFALAIPASIYRREWHDVAAACICHMEETPNFITGDQIDAFVALYLLGTGWMDTFEMLFSDGSRKRYYRIHPLLTNALRQLLVSVPWGGPWRTSLTNKFMEFYFVCVLEPFVERYFMKKWVHMIEIECYNFLSAVDGYIYVFEHHPFIPTKQRATLHTQLPYILRALHIASVKGRSERLPMELIQVRLERFASYLESRLDEGNLDDNENTENSLFSNNVHILVDIHNRLADNILLKYPQKAASYADRALRAVLKGCQKRVSWDVPQREAVTFSLLHRGESSLHYKGRSTLARQAFEMALRCFRREDDSRSTREDSAMIRKRGYTGLANAERAIREFHHYTDGSFNEAAYAAASLKAEKDYFSVTTQNPSIFKTDAGSASAKDTITSNLVEDDMEGWRSSLLTSFKRAEELGKTGSFPASKDFMLSMVAQAQRDNDIYAEHACRYALIDLAIQDQDWAAAAMHIVRDESLEKQSSSTGPEWFAMTAPDRMIREARHGAVFLRLHMLEHALRFFDRGLSALKGTLHTDILYPSSPEAFVDVVLDVGRYGLILLTGEPRYVITVPEFFALDDILQMLTIRHVLDKWPDFDNVEEKRVLKMMKRPEWMAFLSQVDAKSLESQLASGESKLTYIHSADMVRAGPVRVEDNEENEVIEEAAIAIERARGKIRDSGSDVAEEAQLVKRLAKTTLDDGEDGVAHEESVDTDVDQDPTPDAEINTHDDRQTLEQKSLKPKATATSSITAKEDRKTTDDTVDSNKEPRLETRDEINAADTDKGKATEAHYKHKNEDEDEDEDEPPFPSFPAPRTDRRAYRVLPIDPTPTELCDLNPLEEGMPLYDADPEGDFKGLLKHDLLNLPHTY